MKVEKPDKHYLSQDVKFKNTGKSCQYCRPLIYVMKGRFIPVVFPPQSQ